MSPEAEAKKVSFTQKLGAQAYGFFCAILRITDIRIIAILGRCIGYLAWAIMPERRRIVARNLRIVVDPTLKGSHLNNMVRRNIVRTCMNMACTFKTGLLTDKELERAVKLTGRESLDGAAEAGACVIACIPHAGNWEMLARIRPLFPKVKRFGSMYRQLDNPLLEEMVYKARTRFGCEMFSSKKGLKEVFRLANEGGMLGILNDQFTQQGVFVPYFGKVTGTTPLPALIRKRSKGQARVLAVASRNIALGKWEADLTHHVAIPEGNPGMATITHAINQTLEAVQKKSILDGFWMHHRWKPTRKFAPDVDEEQINIIKEHATLPFRIIVCLPEAFEEAILAVQMMRELQGCRPDMQLTVVCPEEQEAFWRTQKYITYVVSTESPAQQLMSETIYKDGPFDYIFMLSENKRVLKELSACVGPVRISGFGTNPLKKFFRSPHYPRAGAVPQHKACDFLSLAGSHIKIKGLSYADARTANTEAKVTYIAPYSTLGAADSWKKENWAELVTRLAGEVQLLALEQDKEAAEQLASEFGIKACIVRPETVANHVGPNCHLYAVDGLIPQLAALVGCPCHVIMASRYAKVYEPLGEGHRVVSNHTPCHPCYRNKCDQAMPCAYEISVADFLEA